MDQVLALPEAERAEFVERSCAAEPRLLERMRRWLGALQSSADFLEHAHTAAVAGTAEVFEPLPPGRMIGAYRVERLLGRGGMGEVYLASRADGQFEQEVAIKLINAATADEPEQFLAERRILARLEHPGITRMFDGGFGADGRPYMVMERVEGRDLLAWCREQRCDLEQRLRLFIQLCQAVGYAHRRLVVHRDIKPGNVLVTREGAVKLLDFGIARLLGTPGARDFSALQATPGFAAPEQLTGGEITAATDVYALGALLYRLLSGRAPVALGGLPTPLAIERALNEEPAPPSAAATPDAPVAPRQLRGDLDAIILKCLRHNPQERYASALALEEDLQRHLRRQTVSARGDAPGYVIGRFVLRHRLMTAAAALLLAVVLGATALVASYAHTVRVQRDLARSQSAWLEDVENYVYRLFAHAGDQPGGAPLTVKAMLDAERQRIDAAPDAPESLNTRRILGQLYAHMDNDAAAVAMLQGYLDRAQKAASPAELAQARADLAQSLLRSGHAAEAQQQLDQAQGFWAADVGRYRSELLDSRVLQSQLLRARGDNATGIQLLRDALAESRLHLGEDSLETAYLYNDLATALQQGGDMPAALQAATSAWDILVRLHHQHTEQGLNALNNIAAMAYYTGQLQQAEPRFREAVALRRELFGPSAALAALLNNYGKLLLKLERPQEAEPLLQEAAQLSAGYTGPDSFLSVASRLSYAQALTANDRPEAEGEVRGTLELAKAKYGDKHLLTAAADLAMARLRFRQKRNAEAMPYLDAGEAAAQALGAPGKGVLAEAQKLRQTYAVGSSSS